MGRRRQAAANDEDGGGCSGRSACLPGSSFTAASRSRRPATSTFWSGRRPISTAVSSANVESTACYAATAATAAGHASSASSSAAS